MADTFTSTDDPKMNRDSQAESEARQDQDTDYSTFGEKGGKSSQDTNNAESGDQGNNGGGLHSHKND